VVAFAKVMMLNVIRAFYKLIFRGFLKFKKVLKNKRDTKIVLKKRRGKRKVIERVERVGRQNREGNKERRRKDGGRMAYYNL
jgi:ribosomal protein S8